MPEGDPGARHHDAAHQDDQPSRVELRKLDPPGEPAHERPDHEAGEKRATRPPQRIGERGDVRRDPARDQRHPHRQRPAEAEERGIGEVFPHCLPMENGFQEVKREQYEQGERAERHPELGEIGGRAQRARKQRRRGARAQA